MILNLGAEIFVRDSKRTEYGGSFSIRAFGVQTNFDFEVAADVHHGDCQQMLVSHYGEIILDIEKLDPENLSKKDRGIIAIFQNGLNGCFTLFQDPSITEVRADIEKHEVPIEDEETLNNIRAAIGIQ